MTKTPKSTQLSMVIFIDALGWEVLKNRSFLEEELPYRRKLRSVFGFSSACVPSILTGRLPRDHRHWSFYYHDAKNSPFKPLRWLRLLPDMLTNRGRVRNWISKLVKRCYGYTGYFQLYQMPFHLINQFDYCEKRDLFAQGGINKGESIFDLLRSRNMAFHCSDWRQGEETNLQSAADALSEGEVPFAFVYLAALDGLLHQVGKDSSKIDTKLAWYEQELRKLMTIANQSYDDVRLFICSDHGMCSVDNIVDLMADIASLGLHEGNDYIATYDSTMARFWFKTTEARERISAKLNELPGGRILSNDELVELGCDFEGDQYGEMIYLVDPGSLIVPSHMGTAPIAGMHGYHPDHADSDASLLSNVEAPAEILAINDVFHLMSSEAANAAAASH